MMVFNFSCLKNYYFCFLGLKIAFKAFKGFVYPNNFVKNYNLRLPCLAVTTNA